MHSYKWVLVYLSHFTKLIQLKFEMKQWKDSTKFYFHNQHIHYVLWLRNWPVVRNKYKLYFLTVHQCSWNRFGPNHVQDMKQLNSLTWNGVYEHHRHLINLYPKFLDSSYKIQAMTKHSSYGSQPTYLIDKPTGASHNHNIKNHTQFRDSLVLLLRKKFPFCSTVIKRSQLLIYSLYWNNQINHSQAKINWS